MPAYRIGEGSCCRMAAEPLYRVKWRRGRARSRRVPRMDTRVREKAGTGIGLNVRILDVVKGDTSPHLNAFREPMEIVSMVVEQRQRVLKREGCNAHTEGKHWVPENVDPEGFKKRVLELQGGR